MSIKSLVKKIAYSPLIVKIVNFFHIRGISRNLYYYLNRPKNNILEATFQGATVRFFLKNPDQLRLVESILGDKGEKPVIERFLSHLTVGDCVYDVGANIGVYSILLAKVVGEPGKIVAFEPESSSIEMLEKNIALNGLKNVTTIRKALGNKNEQMNLYVGETTGNFSLIRPYGKESTHQAVEMVQGDDIVQGQHIPIPKAVKIDVEGYELAVLEGLKNTLSDAKCKIICCEIHPGLFPEGVQEENILSYIQSLGFSNIQKFKRAFSAYHIIAIKP